MLSNRFFRVYSHSVEAGEERGEEMGKNEAENMVHAGGAFQIQPQRVVKVKRNKKMSSSFCVNFTK